MRWFLIYYYLYLDKVMNNRTVRRVYLVTYSRADLTKFPSRWQFGDAVADAFNFGAALARVEYWACCLEKHVDGTDHYHACIKLSAPKRCLSAKDYLSRNFSIQGHFSDDHDNYYQAYKYVTNSDTAVYQSLTHHNLDDIPPPRAAGCVRWNRSRHGQRRNSTDEAGESSNANKITRLTNFEVPEFLVANNIETETELFAQTHSQKAAG